MTDLVYDVATKVLDTEIFPQHNIHGLIYGITFIVLFSQKPLHTLPIVASVNNVRAAPFLKGNFITEQQIQFACWLKNNFKFTEL